MNPKEIEALRKKYGITPGSTTASTGGTPKLDEIKDPNARLAEFKRQAALAQQDEAAPIQVAPEKKSVGGFVKNVGKSGVDLVGSVVDALVHPLRTGKSIGNLAVGAGQKVLGIDGKASESVDALVDFYKNRYGNGNIGNTLYNDPVGVLADLSTLLGGAGAIVRGGSKLGTISDVAKVAGVEGNALRYGANLSKAGSAIDPLNVAAKAGRYIAKESGIGGTAGKAKTFASSVFGKAKTADTITDTTIGRQPKGMEKVALDSGMDEATQTILRRPKAGEKPAQTAKRIENSYNEYSKAEDAYKLDPGADTALEVVGSKIGQSYDKLIKKRREIGAKLGEARDTATSKVDLTSAKTKLAEEMKNAGIVKTSRGYRIGKDGTSLAKDEIKMLTTLEKKLTKLGKNPSAKAISNFKQQFATEIDFAKGKKNITSKTNFDRIKDKIYNSLDEGFNVKDAPDLQNAYNLQKEYSRLSDILEEGAGHLGKKTSSGDYVRDAGLAKASIKSLHAGAKKDFLKQLGLETGDDFIQESMIAAQAMKDAGNFKQASLLEDLAKNVVDDAGSITPTNLISQGVRYGKQKVIEKVAGKPKERTMRYIRDTAPEAAATRTAAKAPEGTRLQKGIRSVKNQLGFGRGGRKNRTRNAVINRSQEEDY